MIRVVTFLSDHPRMALVVGFGALIDAFFCVLQGHSDWTVPALVAFVAELVCDPRKA